MQHQPQKVECQNKKLGSKYCEGDFIIEPEDFDFYEKISSASGRIPPPTFCPTCRAQLRLSFRNERVFYKRPCNKCGKNVVSMYSPNKPFIVYCYDCWYRDDWDGEDFGINYDPSISFLKQYEELWGKVPKVGLIYINSPGSEYINISANNKDCYMIVESSDNENSVNSYWIQECRDVFDVSFSSKCELSYESDGCFNCYKVFYSKECHDSTNSYFLTNCKGCFDCIGCINLVNKSNYIFNQPYSKKEYEKIKEEFKLHSYEYVETLRKKYEEFILNKPRKFSNLVNVLNSTGNYIKNTKNCLHCFHCYEAEDNKYGVHIIRNAKDNMDCDTVGLNSSLIFNSINTALSSNNVISSAVCWGCSFVNYSTYCFNSNYLFGCVGLRKKNYFILNKQYPKEEYIKITQKIIEELKNKDFYGNFFPKHLSCFGYNETPAQEQFPLLKEDAIAQGFKWEDTRSGTYQKETIKTKDIPQSIFDINLDVKKEVFVCINCSKNFKIIKNEYLFYKNLEIPIPRFCLECRHNRRIGARGPNKLWHRICMKEGCANEFETTYAPDRPEIVYCEKCYQNEVY